MIEKGKSAESIFVTSSPNLATTDPVTTAIPAAGPQIINRLPPNNDEHTDPTIAIFQREEKRERERERESLLLSFFFLQISMHKISK